MIILAVTIALSVAYLLIGFGFVTFVRCGELHVWPGSGWTSEGEYGFVLYLWPIWLLFLFVYIVTWPFFNFFPWFTEYANDKADSICRYLTMRRVKQRQRMRERKGE